MSGNGATENNWTRELKNSLPPREPNANEIDAEATLQELAAVFFESKFLAKQPRRITTTKNKQTKIPAISRAVSKPGIVPWSNRFPP